MGTDTTSQLIAPDERSNTTLGALQQGGIDGRRDHAVAAIEILGDTALVVARLVDGGAETFPAQQPAACVVPA